MNGRDIFHICIYIGIDFAGLLLIQWVEMMSYFWFWFFFLSLSGVNVSIIVPLVIGVLVILLCIVFHVLKYYYKNIRRPSRVIRTGGSADVRVIEYLTATPPEYNDALNMRPTVQTISGTVDETQPQITLPHSDLQRDARPPSYGTATSGLFQLTLDNGCPTPPNAGTPTPDMRSNHLDRGEGRRGVDPDQGHHNPAYISDEDSSTPRTPPPNYDGLATDAGRNHIDREEEHREVDPGPGHHNPAFVPNDNNSTPRTPPPNYDGLATDARSNHINREEEHI